MIGVRVWEFSKINPDGEDIMNRKYIQRIPMMAAGKTDHIFRTTVPTDSYPRPEKNYSCCALDN